MKDPKAMTSKLVKSKVGPWFLYPSKIYDVTVYEEAGTWKVILHEMSGTLVGVTRFDSKVKAEQFLAKNV